MRLLYVRRDSIDLTTVTADDGVLSDADAHAVGTFGIDGVLSGR
jgi:hypothetical protein